MTKGRKMKMGVTKMNIRMRIFGVKIVPWFIVPIKLNKRVAGIIFVKLKVSI